MWYFPNPYFPNPTLRSLRQWSKQTLYSVQIDSYGIFQMTIFFVEYHINQNSLIIHLPYFLWIV